jgi:hypothetical protein
VLLEVLDVVQEFLRTDTEVAKSEMCMHHNHHNQMKP